MMSKKTTQLFVGFGLLLFWCIFLSNSSNPPVSRTGAPGEGTCTGCHANVATTAGTVNITGIPSTVVPGQVYTATVTSKITAGMITNSRAGFELTAVNGNGTFVGTLDTIIPNDSTSIATGTVTTYGSRTYIRHKNAKKFVGPTNNATSSWTFKWKAPTTSTNNNISFYVASVLGNGSGSSGDRVVTNIINTVLQPNTPPTVSISSTNLSCFGVPNGSAVANATGGAAPYMYAWSNTATTSNISNLAAGTYTVTVTGANGLTATALKTISQPTKVTATISPTALNICPNTTGTATATVTGGVSPYSYVWNNSNTSNILSVTPTVAGSYTITATDANGCSSTKAIVVTPCMMVTGLTSSPITTTNATLSWTAPSCGALSYQLQWAVNNGGVWSAYTLVNLTGTTLNLPVSCGKQYRWRVRAKCSNNVYSTFTSLVLFTAQPCAALTAKVTPSDNTLQLYPNPANERVAIMLPAGCEQANISLYNMQGQLLKTWSATESLSDLSLMDIPKGVYLMQAVAGDKRWNQKLLVQ